jgi:hypothetical protein
MTKTVGGSTNEFQAPISEDPPLNFKPAHYGPYAENLRHVLRMIEGHLVSG